MVELAWGGSLTNGATPSIYKPAALCLHNQGYMDGGRQCPACMSAYVDISQSQYIQPITKQTGNLSDFIYLSYSYPPCTSSTIAYG